MADTNHLQETRLAIEQRVEALAMQLLVDGGQEADGRQWSEALSALAIAAEAHGEGGIASLAREVAAQVAAASPAKKTRECFETGIVRLQEALLTSSKAAEPETARPQKLSLDRELIGDFVMESREHLNAIEGLLLALERNARDMEAIHSIFRGFHTIKGLAGFLELEYVKQVAHEVETLLDHARESRLVVTPPVIDVILESSDYLNRWLKFLEETPFAEVPEAICRNQELLNRILLVATGGVPGAAEDQGTEPANHYEMHLEMDLNPDIEDEEEISSVSLSAPVAYSEAAPFAKQGPAAGARRTTASRSVKVDTEKLDYLVDMVGELVIAQSVVRNDPDVANSQKVSLVRNLTQLTRITGEVQRTAMSMRMVPIGPLFQKMARMVRDLTRKFGKQAQLETFGEDVQLDRTIVEELADPLMHMIRNSVDHGIEKPEVRQAAGKSPVARVELRAFHLAGQIVIQISDDGQGLNRGKILAKAVKNGLIAANVNLSDSECFNLIFQPGFSTAEILSDVSGRGVGMDVVKRQIQKLRGSVDIQSTAGKGTTFSLKLPLTMAIIDGLVVGVGKERYIIPLFAVREMLRPTADRVSTIEGRAEVLMVRNTLLPVVRLYERFGVEPRSRKPEEAVFVVTEHDGKPFCLMVDELLGKQEVVIKTLGKMFQGVTGVAGGAILGDGRVGLILDMQGVFRS
ncbi:MAG: chemotaxis protein CheA [Bryobacteraceae bacterium]